VDDEGNEMGELSSLIDGKQNVEEIKKFKDFPENNIFIGGWQRPGSNYTWTITRNSDNL